MSILSFLWYVVMVFLFVAYLFILFYIFSDLFRRHDMNGWLKALWVIILIFIFPPLGALIYLIVYGKGMAERAQKAQQEMVSAQQAYIREARARPVRLTRSRRPRRCSTTVRSPRRSSTRSRARRWAPKQGSPSRSWARSVHADRAQLRSDNPSVPSAWRTGTKPPLEPVGRLP